MISGIFEHYLEGLHQRYANLSEGEVASYIPELSKADPQWFGIVLATVDGHIYRVGETSQTFTVQSISKVFTYGMALEKHGVEGVLRKVGIEPSGEAFNSISLEPATGRPMNPMINAGAIATTSMLTGNTPGEGLRSVLNAFGRYTGHKMVVDEAVYISEKTTGHRNRAISHLLVNYGIIEGEPEAGLDLYFKQCSILANCRDLAIMAATLANQGVNPITGVRAVDAKYVPKMLSVMASCGMYDYSGAWIYDVGMPAKSGVGGGIMAVLPGRFGLAVFSPPLDAKGNSARGIAVCKAVSDDFGLHILQTARATFGSVVRAAYDLSEVSSKRTRKPEVTSQLTQLGKLAMVLELAGELTFTSVEIILTKVAEEAGEVTYLILDFRRVASLDTAATNLLSNLVKTLDAQAKQVLFTNIQQIYGLETQLKHYLPQLHEMALLRFTNLDSAMEWCEDCILQNVGVEVHADKAVSLAEQSICHGLSAEELRYLGSFLQPQQYVQGEYLCREGDADTRLYLILSGQVSVILPLGEKRTQRLATLTGGAILGELAMIENSSRSADVIADSEVQTLILDCHRLEHDASPIAQSIRLTLLRNTARGLSNRLRKANHEIRSLTR